MIFFNSSRVLARQSIVHNWLPSIWVRQSLLVLYKYMGYSLYGLKIKIHLRRKQRLHKIKKWLGHLGLEVISIARWLSCSLSYSYIIPFLWCPTIQCKGRTSIILLVNCCRRRSLAKFLTVQLWLYITLVFGSNSNLKICKVI